MASGYGLQEGRPKGGWPLLFIAVLAAVIIWYFLFAVPGTPFWVVIAAATFMLGGGTLLVFPDTLRAHPRTWSRFILMGFVAAFVLYGLFALGDKAVRVVLADGAHQVANVYATRAQAQPTVIGLLLFFIIGPGEELFWRGWVQRTFSARFGAIGGYLITTAVYILVHVPSMNLTLIGAAAVAGAFWGYLYVLYGHIGPGLVSHALWDVSVFILFPFH
ncbi:MAG: type II CAAX endopeptidase family protein [bacterium]